MTRVLKHYISESESLTPESPFVMILVVSLSVVAVLLLVSIIVCVVRRKQKESPSVQEPGEVSLFVLVRSNIFANMPSIYFN